MARVKHTTQSRFGAMTSNVDLDHFRYVFRKKQSGVALSVYDGKKLIGKVGAITEGNCYTDDQTTLVQYRRPANVVSAEILPEYRGKKLYQEMLLRFRKYAKEELGCKGLKSEGFQRSKDATRAWEKVADRAEEASWGRKDFFLDGVRFVKPREWDVHTRVSPGGCVTLELENSNTGDWLADMSACPRFRGGGKTTLQIEHIRVDPEWRRKGISTYLTERMMLIAEGREMPLQSDWSVSAMRDPFWKKQVEKGRASKVVDEKGRPTYLLSYPPLESLGALPKKGRIPLKTVKKALKLLPPGRRACKITAANLREGLEVEREHRDITRGGLKKTALIAAAHLCERPDYYKRLKRFVEK